MSQFLYYASIIDLLQNNINEISKENWKEDECKPEFWISINNDDMGKQQILITISHNGLKFSQNLFPRLGTEYGYHSILDQMQSMYSCTM